MIRKNICPHLELIFHCIHEVVLFVDIIFCVYLYMCTVLVLSSECDSLLPEPLTVECVGGAVSGRVTIECNTSNTVNSTTCAFDGGPAEPCSLPLRLLIAEYGTEQHTVIITITDEFGQSVSTEVSFSIAPPLFNIQCDVSAVPGRAEFDCSSSNNIVSTVCAYDGGPPQNCTLPVTATYPEFSEGDHTVVVTATDEYGQTATSTLSFQIVAPTEPPTPGTRSH